MTAVLPHGAGSFIGLPVRRVEDPTLLQGEGTYIDNLQVPGMLEVAFVRSPIAHARDRVDRHRAPRVTMPGRRRRVRRRRHRRARLLPVHEPQARVSATVARQGQGPLRRRDRRGRRRRDARCRPPTPPTPWSSTTTRCPPSPTWTPRSHPTRRCCSTAIGSNAVLGLREPPGARPPRGRRRRRAWPLREPARSRSCPMEGAAVAVVPGDDGLGHQLTIHVGLPDAAHDPDGDGRAVRHRHGRPADHRPARGRRVRRQALDARGQRGPAHRGRARTARCAGSSRAPRTSSR